MAISRPVLLALIGAVLAAATWLSALSGHERSARNDAAAPPAPARPAHTAKKPAEAPQPVAKRPARPAAREPATPAKAHGRRPSATRRDEGVPPGVAQALAAHRVVVLFLTQSGADDAATATAVASLRGLGRRVAVFSDGVAHIARYEALVAAVGVSQAPAVVIVGPDRKAHLIEGYVDAETLRQRVADASR
jgi:hypothetical protein